MALKKTPSQSDFEYFSSSDRQKPASAPARCLFIRPFSVFLESYLISWTLKPETQPTLIKGNTLLCSSTTHPLFYANSHTVLWGGFFFSPFTLLLLFGSLTYLFRITLYWQGTTGTSEKTRDQSQDFLNLAWVMMQWDVKRTFLPLPLSLSPRKDLWQHSRYLFVQRWLK